MFNTPSVFLQIKKKLKTFRNKYFFSKNQKFNIKSFLKILIKTTILIIILFYVLYFINVLYFRPFNVKVSNISSNSFTVTWTTRVPMKGSVIYSESSKLNYLPYPFNLLFSDIAYDRRDITKADLETLKKIKATKAFKNKVEVRVKKQGKYYVHYVTINNLKPQTKYYFKVGNGFLIWGDWLTIKDDGLVQGSANVSKFNILTYKELSYLIKPNPSFGTIQFFDKKPVTDGYVIGYITTDKEKPALGIISYPLVSLLNNQGAYYLELANARSVLTGAYINFAKNEKKYFELIEIYTKEGYVMSKVIPLTADAPANLITLPYNSDSTFLAKNPLAKGIKQNLKDSKENAGLICRFFKRNKTTGCVLQCESKFDPSGKCIKNGESIKCFIIGCKER